VCVRARVCVCACVCVCMCVCVLSSSSTPHLSSKLSILVRRWPKTLLHSVACHDLSRATTRALEAAVVVVAAASAAVVVVRLSRRLERHGFQQTARQRHRLPTLLWPWCFELNAGCFRALASPSEPRTFRTLSRARDLSPSLCKDVRHSSSNSRSAVKLPLGFHDQLNVQLKMIRHRLQQQERCSSRHRRRCRRRCRRLCRRRVEQRAKTTIANARWMPCLPR
jgi:hypothetical protein